MARGRYVLESVFLCLLRNRFNGLFYLQPCRKQNPFLVLDSSFCTAACVLFYKPACADKETQIAFYSFIDVPCAMSAFSGLLYLHKGKLVLRCDVIGIFRLSRNIYAYLYSKIQYSLQNKKIQRLCFRRNRFYYIERASSRNKRLHRYK